MSALESPSNKNRVKLGVSGFPSDCTGQPAAGAGVTETQRSVQEDV